MRVIIVHYLMLTNTYTFLPQIILSEFPEQANLSVLHMTSLFHAFQLCQLWTMYCENIASQNLPGSEQYNWSTLTLCDFWSKVTPNILQLICSSKQVGG